MGHCIVLLVNFRIRKKTGLHSNLSLKCIRVESVLRFRDKEFIKISHAHLITIYEYTFALVKWACSMKDCKVKVNLQEQICLIYFFLLKHTLLPDCNNWISKTAERSSLLLRKYCSTWRLLLKDTFLETQEHIANTLIFHLFAGFSVCRKSLPSDCPFSKFSGLFYFYVDSSSPSVSESGSPALLKL